MRIPTPPNFDTMPDSIEELLLALRPIDGLEEEQIAETLAWARSGEPLFRVAKPATPPKHLVSYFVLIDPSNRKMLLVDHINAGLWLPTGGHVEPEEHPRQTVCREVVEELGIEACFLVDQPLFLTVTVTVGNTPGHTDVTLWYLLRGDSTQPLDYDKGEFRGIAWFPIDALPLERSDPQLGRFAAKLHAYLKQVG